MNQALAWEHKATEQGGPFALTAEESIAGIYLKGDGVPQDYAEAARWLRRAGEHGSPTSYLTLAQLDEKGLGGPPDPFEAYVGYSIALTWLKGQQGPTNLTEAVAKHRGDVAAKLTPTQISRADEIVRKHGQAAH